MHEHPRATTDVRRSPVAAPPQAFHCIDLERVGDEISVCLQRAFTDGAELVVTVGGEPQITVQTVEDLEVLHQTLDDRAAGVAEHPSPSA